MNPAVMLASEVERISVQEYAAAFAEPIVKISVNALVTLTRWMNDAFMASRSLYLEDARIVASVFVPAMTSDGSPLDPPGAYSPTYSN